MAAGDQSALNETEVVATATFIAPSTELAELKALAATQQCQVNTALSQLTKITSSGGGGGGKKKKEKGRHVCKNFKRLVYHDDNKCMDLEKNTHLCYVGWKSYLE